MRTKQKLIAYFLSFALLLGMISTVNVSAAKKIRLSNKKITITKGSSKTIKVKNTKKKVKWKVLSGKKCITLKKKSKTAATVKGKKKGNAKIQALVEKKKLVCTVTVDDKVISEQQNNSQSGITTNIPGDNAVNQLPTTDINNPTPGSGEPTQIPDATIPTEPPYQGEIITLHYNDDNAYEISKQIEDSENPVHVIVDEGVTSIGDWAFEDCDNLMSIEIPGSVTNIGNWAFWGCSGLTSIEIPGSVTSIGKDRAFCGCSGLTSIKVAENNPIYDSRNDCNAIIETETNTLIRGCKNTKIPGSVTSIWYNAFSGCSSLTSIEIPESVTSIGDSAFSDCSGLTSIKVAENNQIYDSRNNCNAIIETETNTLLIGCKNTKIPESVTSIGDSAFSDCSGLTSIEIPGSVTSIGDSAFSDCSGLTSIEIPGSVTSIGSEVFLRCDRLTSIKVAENNPIYDSRNNCNAIIETETNTLLIGCKNTKIPESVTSIGEHAFEDCSSLMSIEIPNSVTSIGDSAFDRCSSLTSIEIPNSVTSIGRHAFCSCSSLTSIEIPNSVTSIGDSAFSRCSSLTSIKVAENNPIYDSRNDCNAIIETETNELIIGCKNTKIPESVTGIGDYAFQNCSSLTSIEIPESVTNIWQSAFSGCSSLTSIKIPVSVTRIWYDAFWFCDSLTSIIWQGTTYNSADEFMNAFHTKYPDF